MKTFITSVLCILFFSAESFSQLYQGPANGSVPNGAIVNTGTFMTDMSGEPLPQYLKKLRNKERIEPYPDNINTIEPTGPAGSNYTEDNYRGTNPPPLLLSSFPGAQDPGNYIPPDTYIAAGPTHVMGVDNGFFFIWTKTGELVNKINADSWFNSALSGAAAFDPKVSYDHFNKRWIMVWLDQDDATARGYFLISISDDSIPTGTWYNWAIKSSLNGNTESGSWGDYQGVGFDQQAIYLTTNQFAFGGSFQGAKTRIVGKAQLYNNTAGPLVWTDLWDIRDPVTSARIFGHRPSIVYGNSGEYYSLCTSPAATGTYMILYRIVNPLTAPVMTAVNVPVVSYSSPPNANQLGGSTILIEGGGSSLKNEPTFRDGYLYAVHAVRTTSGYSAVSYLKLDVATNTAVEDYSFGQEGFWHTYPALAVDKDNNIAMTFSRSGLTEYMGAYYNTRLSTDPQGTFSGTRVLKSGEANYVKDFGSGRNRWGDYMGIWLDPSDQNNFWLHTEYSKFPSSTWANQVGQIRLIPFSSAAMYTSVDSLNFGTKEIGFQSDTMHFSIYNYGTPALTINSITSQGSQFQILNMPTLPSSLNYRDSIYLKVLYTPSITGNVKDSIVISGNSSSNPVQSVYLYGKGYFINPVQVKTMYAVTGALSNGILMTINSATGVGTSVGESGFTQLNGLSIRPSNNELYASISNSPVTQLVRINSTSGDAYNTSPIPIADIRAIAFDLNDLLYCSSTNGKLYSYNVTSGDTNYIGSTGITNLFGLSINPVNGSLWGINVTGNVYKINKLDASSAAIGSTGNSPNTAMAFDKNGVLYGLAGIGSQLNRLISIDTTNGAGTLIGTNIGFASANGLAISPDIVGIQNITTGIPERYELYQNYPNPFNPSTSIKFDIPKTEKVQLIVYNMLGKEITKLVNERLVAGTYEYKFDASSLSSGVYFYRLASGNLSFTKRMLLIK
ncbi:MAG: T9SS type A sorting domain-containing protein [Ignavibacteriae bacterium]|nr:T9SS type A sorting domain-containing protein [Ignavibacteriota bacterium]